ncbi:unnamed protein product [Cuscuta epithymum]|uniref:Kinesin motor domain-containing protein n=1 Tax=Cuscuta epithymum TaxID=186058 RepID=A0AAV0CC16_9ASTE|nr:unnamed protein product [Cuscuta epithymum]
MACALETPISVACVPQMGEIQVNSDSVDEKHQEQTVSVLQNLNNKLNDLKRVHTALRDEVKDITANPFPSFEALKDLSTQHELLKKRYLDECSERKRLYNEVIEMKGNIRVFCRCRPLNPNEIANGSTSVVEFDLSQENEIQIVSSDSTRKQFRFDHVFKPEDGQEAVFAETMPIVTSVLDGFNVCIFAYGQTGTGKTFTMEGTPENRGVNYRTLEKLFSSAKQRSSIMKFELFVSMLEVYNDKIRDLLIEKCNQPAKKVEVKLSAEGTQEVQGLREIPVYGTDDVWELLQSGSRARSVGSTCANELSSRSHCLLRLTVIGENLVNAQRTRSNLWLVDLAGSERVGRIEAEGERLKESQFINKSLSALGDVISALAAKMAHVPYRNSKLTHILQSSLGADCKTVMFVQISPSSADLGETLCSLNFASRVRGVEHGPARKLADLTEISKNKQLAEKSKHDEREMKKLQDSVQSLQLRLSAREHTCKNLQQKVLHLEKKLVEEKKKQLKLKQENRVSAAVSNQSSSALPSLNQTRMMAARTERKPPLALRPRLPLQKITHLVPQQPSSVLHPRRSLLLPTVYEDKENAIMASKDNTDVKARQDTHAIKSIPTQATNLQVKQPTRRASMATLRPPESGMIVPAKNSAVRPRNDGPSMGRQSFVWDPQRVWRTSKVLSPKLEDEKSSAASVLHEAPPVVSRCSKPLGSPRLPTVVALQKKRLVWSPLKMKAYAGLKSRRVSHAIKPTLPQAINLQVKKQPMRRASLATLLPQESDSTVSPGKSSVVRSRNNHRSMGRQSYVWDPQRVWCKSRVLSPPQEEETTLTAALVEATPVGPKCSNSMGSPPSQQPGSWRPKHPTVVALQKKLLWSDPKMKENTGSKARRVSFAIRLTPPQAKNRRVKQPLRRASLATLHPTESCMITPAKSSIVHHENDYRSRGRQSFVWDPQRMRRTSRLFSPLVEEEKPIAAAATLVVDTPVSSSCSKVMESPCSQQAAGSWWRPKLPTVIELPKKQLVWSPLKMKVMQSSNRNSFLAS